MEKKDALLIKVKNIAKRYPRFFRFWFNTVAFVTGKRASSIVRTLPEGSVIIDVGAGAKIKDPRIIAIDMVPYPNISIIADAHMLPFENNSVDMVISENMLEHVRDPETVVAEFHRVLKPGGTIFVVTPFLLGFHSSPDDYHRWTTSGLRTLFRDFDTKEIGPWVGPTGALVSVLREWFAMVLSFGSVTLYQWWIIIFMIIFIPLNIFDFLLIRYKFSENIAMSYYYIGIKE